MRFFVSVLNAEKEEEPCASTVDETLLDIHGDMLIIIKVICIALIQHLIKGLNNNKLGHMKILKYNNK